jgi:hypothetical protein
MRRPRPEWGCWETGKKVIGLPKKATEIDVERTDRDLLEGDVLEVTWRY